MTDDCRTGTLIATDPAVPTPVLEGARSASRRDFLRLAGLGAAVLMFPPLISACNEDPLVPDDYAGFDLNTDAGLLNFAYLSYQFRDEFYQYVTYAPFFGAMSLEVNGVNSALWKLSTHSQSVARMFGNTIESNRITSVVEFDFRKINFKTRDTVYAVALEFEQKSLGMMTELMCRAKDPETLMILAKLQSVCGRYTAMVHDFADIAAGKDNSPQRTGFASDTQIPSTGLEPRVALAEYATFIRQWTITELDIVGA